MGRVLVERSAAGVRLRVHSETNMGRRDDDPSDAPQEGRPALPGAEVRRPEGRVAVSVPLVPTAPASAPPPHSKTRRFR